MIAAGFAYAAPRAIEEAVALLAGDPDGSRPLGGGTWLIPELSSGDASPRLIVGLRRAGLKSIERSGDDGILIGAMATYSDLLASPAVQRCAPLLARVAESITGGWAIRNQGTVGGSFAAARPQSDLPAALVACEARAIVHGPDTERRVVAADLLAGPMRTHLGRDELLSGFELRRSAATGVGYSKLKRGASSWPIVTAAALIEHAGRECAGARLVLGGATAVPLVVDVAGALVGARVTPAGLAEVARIVKDVIREPWADALAPGAYRAAVAGTVARRALEMALHDRGGSRCS